MIPTFIRCRYCSDRVDVSKLDAHLRDTGDISEPPMEACPVLFERRQSKMVASSTS